MSQKSPIIHEAAGQITLIELNSLENCLPVSPETYKRILHGLSENGTIKLPEPNQMRPKQPNVKKMRKTRQ